MIEYYWLLSLHDNTDSHLITVKGAEQWLTHLDDCPSYQ